MLRQIVYPQTRYLPALIVAIALLAIFVGGFALQYIETQLVAAAGESLTLAAVDIADKLDLLMAERYGDIQMMAHSQTFQGRDRAAMSRYLSWMISAYPLYDWLGVLDADGRIVAATDPTSVGRDRSAREWFTAVRDHGEIHVRDAQVSEDSHGGIAVAFTAAIRGIGGEFHGVVSSRVALSILENEFAQTVNALQAQWGPAAHIEYQFVSEAGRVIADSQIQTESDANLKQLGVPSAQLFRAATSGFVEEQHARRQVPVVTGYARTKGVAPSRSLRWGVLVRVDRSDILLPIQSVLWKLSAAGLAAGVPLLAVLIWTTRRLQREHGQMQEMMNILDASRDGLFIFDVESLRFLYVNQGAQLQTGYSQEELLIMTPVDIKPAFDEPGFRDLLAQVRVGASSTHMFTTVHRRKNGVDVPVEITLQYRARQGQSGCCIAVVRDITERLRGEQALHESEGRTRHILETALDAFIGMDAGGFIIDWNAQAERLFGWSRQEAIGRLLAVTIIPAQHREAHEHGLRRFLATGEGPVLNTLMEITACHRDGHEFPVELTISATRASGGDYTFSAFLRDISMRKREETALRISEERYSLLARAANDVLWDWDLPTNRVWWSDGLQQIFGYNPKEVEPGVESWSTRIHPDDFSSVMAGVDDVIKGGGEAWSGEYRFRRVDGSYVYTFDRALLVRNEQGTVVRMAGSMVDLTARKQAEEALRQAKSEAEAASQAKSGFLATMSHEIRTPMNGVIGMTRLLLDTDLTAEQREFAETVRSSGEHLLTLISDILDFSKIEAGKMTLETIDFDLRNAVAEAVDLLAGQASAKRLNLACLFHADVPSSLRGDPGRLRQVLLNLLSNAIKFTNQGDVTLSVTLRQQTEDAATVRFEVQDSGIGLSTEAQGRLFQSFSQADSSTTRKFGGTGLGLAICKQLTELMGGDIGVESQPREGSLFWFTVPFGKQPPSIASVRDLVLPEAHPLQLCIVDDNPINQRVLELYTQRWGAHCLMAKDGREALGLLRQAAAQGHVCDLAIIDMQLPGMNGLDLARAIKADPVLAPIKLIMVTSQGLRGDAKAAQEAGYAAYLSKPVQAEQLYQCLATVLHAPAAPANQPAPPELITRHSLAEQHAQSSIRILLAEDNVINQKVAVRMLEKLGYRVDLVANGQEALDALSDIRYAAVLMDCQMPHMDGFAATTEIRKREGTDRHTPIIAMTANAQQEDQRQCLASGMDDYVSKPVQLKVLAEVLTRWIGAEPSAAQSPDGLPLKRSLTVNPTDDPKDLGAPHG